MEVNSSREGREFEAEFIRLKLGPTEASIARPDTSSRAKKADIKQHVKKEGKRIVIQDIPMVDQGQKGYCVVATAAVCSLIMEWIMWISTNWPHWAIRQLPEEQALLKWRKT